MEPVAAVGGILFCQQEVLLVVEQEDRPSLNKRAGMLSIPMGHVKLKSGEEPEHAIVREVREETGLEVAVVEPLRDFVEYPVAVGTLSFRAFLLECTDKDDTSDGELEVCWMNVEDLFVLPKGETRPLVQEIVRAALYRVTRMASESLSRA
jgi:8-oxo-dGTP pyrophosphatase MutT (NUDIX family)